MKVSIFRPQNAQTGVSDALYIDTLCKAALEIIVILYSYTSGQLYSSNVDQLTNNHLNHL